MFNFKTLLASILVIIFTISANAALNSDSTCIGSQVPGQGEWTMTCDTTPIVGVGVCSSDTDEIGETADMIVTTGDPDKNLYCWCKMNMPESSPYVYANGYGTAELCLDYCANLCVLFAGEDASFRSRLFSNFQ